MEATDEIASIMEGNEDEDCIQKLLDREVSSGRIQAQGFRGAWISLARLDGIEYILERRAFLGMRFQTAYLSVAYLDGFLSRTRIRIEAPWVVRLLSMACLSLAAKMEETALPLSEFRWGAFSFESRDIGRMELLVLNTLDWRMRLVTPLEFIHFFIKKLYENSSRNGVSRIVQLLLRATKDEEIMRHKPSVIGASATVVALDGSRLTGHALELKITPLTSRGVLEIEDFTACYYQIQGLDSGNWRPSLEIKSPGELPSHSHRAASGDDADTPENSLHGAKRRRLEFSDQTDDLPNKKQDER